MLDLETLVGVWGSVNSSYCSGCFEVWVDLAERLFWVSISFWGLSRSEVLKSAF